MLEVFPSRCRRRSRSQDCETSSSSSDDQGTTTTTRGSPTSTSDEDEVASRTQGSLFCFFSSPRSPSGDKGKKGTAKTTTTKGSPPPSASETKRLTVPSAIKMIYVALAFTPRLALYFLVFVLGQSCRALAKLFCPSVGAPHAANKRILYVSDYMPPQCHGIALRVSEYTKFLRGRGHEVHVYTCCVESRARTSFDHPTLPYVANPFNSGNQISYSVGVKLAWALGAESWDVVHVFYPNCLGLFVLPACRWRGVASYCSHHVSMDEYAKRYIDMEGKWPVLQCLCRAAYALLYDVCYRLPASYWGDVNSSMTRTFVKRHLPLAEKYSHVATIASGVDVQRFHRRETTSSKSSKIVRDDAADDREGRLSPNPNMPNGHGGAESDDHAVFSDDRSSPDDSYDDDDDDQEERQGGTTTTTPTTTTTTHRKKKKKKSQTDTLDLGWLWLDQEACASEREALCRRIGAPHDDSLTQIWVMVQRLAPEKDTQVALEALAALKELRPKAFAKTWLVVAGDGPARESLELKASELFRGKDDAPGRVTFLGAVKNERLPSLYRSADVFITCSRSETFGLTVTEALASGATVALPSCPVFDELYGERLPERWRYDADDTRGAHVALLDAVAEATSEEARRWLEENPIDASWDAAAADLDAQYDDAIQRGRTKYTNVRQYVQKRLIHLCRGALLGVSLYFILSLYYRSFYCHLTECQLLLPNLPRQVRLVSLLTFILALEWCHC